MIGNELPELTDEERAALAARHDEITEKIRSGWAQDGDILPEDEMDLSQCENQDDDGVRCHHRGKWRGPLGYLCQDCAEGYCV